MRRAIVTGANTGLGLATATALARADYSVCLAVRNTGKGDAAAKTIAAAVPEATVDVRPLDLADLESVRQFADTWLADAAPLDALVNNAGVMLVPQRTLTRDGFEQHMGVNFLGHHLLTALLLPALVQSSEIQGGGRVVGVSSLAHRVGRIDRTLGLAGRYAPMRAYGHSKLAVLMGARELDRRLRAAGINVRSVAAHPGWSATDLTAPRDRGDKPGAMVAAARQVSQWLGSSPEHGAAAQVLATTSPGLAGGSYLGPRFQTHGPPRPARPAKAVDQPDDNAWLWERADELTGATWPWSSSPTPPA